VQFYQENDEDLESQTRTSKRKSRIDFLENSSRNK